MTKLFVVVFMLVLLGGDLPVAAQSQEGSISIASQIRPANENRLSEFAECVITLTKVGFRAEESAKQCREVVKIVAAEAMKIANEAADATKASRPVVIVGSPYGYRGYYGYGRSYSWGIRIGSSHRIYHRSYTRRHRR